MRARSLSLVLLLVAACAPGAGLAAPFTFSTGVPDGRMGMASRPASGSTIRIDAADDFILASPTTLDQATFTGLLPAAAPLSDVTAVGVDIYRVFPQDSANPPAGDVPTRVNSPSDTAVATRSSGAADLTFAAAVQNASFAVSNSVINGIHPVPNSTTGGDGPATGEEVLFSVTFTTPVALPAGHYFVVPHVGLSSGTFLWLSVARPIVAPGTSFSGDLESWIRDANLAPDWLRVGTDVVGGGTPPTFNAAFSVGGSISDAAAGAPVAVPSVDAAGLAALVAGLAAIGLCALPRGRGRRRR